jgi:pimeloyl-ACP methyl ester carboxylesterase
MRSLGLAQFDVFAEPLASSLAIQLAVQEPDRVAKLVLDSVTMVTTRQRAAMKREYAPAVAPRSDGTHLHAMWHMLRDLELNWPWYSRDIESIRVRDPDLSASRLNGRLVELMKQLEHYGDAALAALDCPIAALLPQVSQPALLLYDESDVRYRDTRRAARLIKNASIAPAGGGNAAIAGAVRRFLDA